MVSARSLARAALALVPLAARSAAAYMVSISDADYARQTCSGMWANDQTHINVTFAPSSQGQLSMVIYEWSDVEYLGKDTSVDDEYLPRTYICTSDAFRLGLCTEPELGRFILNLPAGQHVGDTSFYSARVAFGNATTTSGAANATAAAASGFWNNPAGNPPVDEKDKPYTSPWRRSVQHADALARRDDDGHTHSDNISPEGILRYTEPITYHVHKTGYYCVAVVPVTVLAASDDTNGTDVPFHPKYSGEVVFRNTFNGNLPASDYPKVNFYFVMFLIYAILGSTWAWLCHKHREDLLPIQYYLSGLVGFLVVEMVANWVYYRYLNAHGRSMGSTVFLFVVAILDAGRNALSFFMLLVVAMGLSVVRESLGGTMLRCQLLTGAHFVFGVLYAVGVVELELESTSALVLLLFVIPLAFTLSGFLLWILYSLNGTIMQLTVRKQHYKLSMFTRLYQILWGCVVVIAGFFVVSSMSFSERLAEDYAANTWRSRWWLLDGWLALLYLAAFWTIAYLWRPTGSNRYLAMSDELAQDDDDAEDYDMAALERGQRSGRGGVGGPDGDEDEDDAATLVGSTRRARPLADDQVVFEIGDEAASDDSDDEDKRRAGTTPRPGGGAAAAAPGRPRADSLDRREGAGEEREGLMGRKDD